MQIECDATVWLEHGLPGIVIGRDRDIISVLWYNGNVTRVRKNRIVHCEPCYLPSVSIGVCAVRFGIHDGASDMPLTEAEWNEIESLGFTKKDIELLWGKRPIFKKEQQ